MDWLGFLTQHERWLRTVAYARLGEALAVDDVMQEVALAVVQPKAPKPEAVAVAPWLYRVTIHQCLLYRRKCGRRRRLTAQYAARCPPQEHDSGSPDPLHWLLVDERRTLVRRALEQLPRRDSEILLLKYTENWNYQQIAQRLGISHSAVEARLFRARGRMRAALTQLEVSEVLR